MTGTPRFHKLLEPYHIGKVQTRNRMIKSAADMGFSDADGNVSLKHKLYYEALARGGVGLIIFETSMIEPFKGDGPHTFLRICDDRNIPGLTELVNLIHKHDCPVFILLGGGDMLQFSDESDKPTPFGGMPHPLVTLWRREPSHPDMNVSDLHNLVDTYAAAAGRAKKAGFDGVEIHSASMSLDNCLLSRAWNKRQDEYGGSIENRTRFLVEILHAIKDRAGKDFPVSVLINGAELGIDEGITPGESAQIARILEAAGADAIHVRAWGFNDYSGERVHIPDQLFYPEPPPLPEGVDGSRHGAGLLLPLAAAIKKAVSIPVISVGRFDAGLADKAIRNGQADFIAFNRRLLADPEYPNKVASGSLEDIAPCTACMHCFGRVSLELPVQCRVNAFLGGDREYSVQPAHQKKRVLIFGGGPAGMEAARVAALRGHDVTLYEKSHKTGGLLSLAGMVKGLEIEDLAALVDYLEKQVKKLGVRIKLGKEGDASVIEQIKPDVLILATGGINSVPEIPGIKLKIVVSGGELHRKLKKYLKFFGPAVLRWLTRFWMPLGKRVIIIGGDIQGVELAEFLVKRGRKVTVVDTAEALGTGLTEWHKVHLSEWLAKKGVTMLPGVKYEEITDNGLTVITKAGQRLTIEADTIIPSLPMKPDIEFIKTMEGKVSEIHAIGDCVEPRQIVDAVADGFRISINI